MNLFSIANIFSDKPSKIQLPSKRPIIISKVNNRGVVYGSLGNTQSRTSFTESEYNLGEISKVIDVEAYVRQAFGKHAELCLKEGYQISSRNADATEYIKRRFKEMAEVSGVTFDMLLRSVTQNIVAYSNAFIVKARDYKKSSGQPIPRQVGSFIQPIAAYFPLDPTSVRIKRDLHGKVLKYQQKVAANPLAPEFNPEDIVHIYYDRKEGLAFGTPYIIPVLDDIRTLRRMEENIEMLITQHLFPLYQYIVGTEENPAEIYEDGTTEVDVIREQIENMPTEGSIVTPERHEIKNLGAEGKALDASNYLEYFEKRVLAGLGISEIALGRGGTANRSTATTIDKMLQDRCKDFQDVIENFVNEYILKELLYEGGYAIDEHEDNFVKLHFKEIDIDSMLKVENHSVFKYEHDAITETEMRELLGKDPVPDDQREDMYFERVTKPKAIIMAVDEPFTAEAKGAAIQKVSKEEKKKREASNREKPTNQHGTKPAKTREKTDISDKVYEELDHVWTLTKLDIIDMINDYDMEEMKNINLEKIYPIAKLSYDDLLLRVSRLDVNHKLFDSMIKDAFNDMGDCICDGISVLKDKNDSTYIISGIFESLKYQLKDISEKVIIENNQEE